FFCEFTFHLNAYGEPCRCFEDQKFDSPPGDEMKLSPIKRLSLRWYVATYFVNTPISKIDYFLDEVLDDEYERFLEMYRSYVPKFQKLREEARNFLSKCDRHHHFSHFDQVTEHLEALNDLHYEWDVKLRRFVHDNRIHAQFSNRFMP